MKINITNTVVDQSIDLNSKKEIWKDVPDYIGIYKISSYGRLMSLNYNRTGIKKIMKPTINGVGYEIVRLSNNGKIKIYSIHKLMAITFMNHRHNGHRLVVDHIDNNRSNNHLSNLQIISHRENINKRTSRYSSKMPGVSYDKAIKKWRARITLNYNTKHLGFYNNELDAAKAYQDELKKIIK